MGTLASGSIDLKSLKVAGEPNKYITYIDATNGIRVHEAGAENTNFIQINSTGMSIYTGGQAESNKVAEFKSYITLGTRAVSLFESEATSLTPGRGSATIGQALIAQGDYSFASGYETEAVGNFTHSEGWRTYAVGAYSHSEGEATYAYGIGSHAGGSESKAGYKENDTLYGHYSFVHGDHVKAMANHQIVFGKYNEEDSNAMFIIGNGTDNTNRSNAFVIDGEGNLSVQDGFKIISNENSELVLSSNGIDINQNDVSIAEFGANNSRIGSENSARLVLEPTMMSLISDENVNFFSVDSDIGTMTGNIKAGDKKSGFNSVTLTLNEVPSNLAINFRCNCSYHVYFAEGTSHVYNYEKRVNSNYINVAYPVVKKSGKDWSVSFNAYIGPIYYGTPLTTNTTKAYTFLKVDGNSEALQSYVYLDYDGAHSLTITLAVSRKSPVSAVDNKMIETTEPTYTGTIHGPAYSIGTREGVANLYSTIIGRSLETSAQDQLVIGKYNTSDGTEGCAFVIGNGTSSDAVSNALTVDWSGNVDIASGAKYKIGGVALADIFYPVGSYYDTSDSSFDPNTSLGGTWSSETIVDDEIVEQGTNSIWTYRKWKSGIAECWGRRDVTISLTDSYGGAYYKTDSVSFPTGLFSAEPVVTATRQGRAGAGLIHISPYSVSSSQVQYFITNTNASYPNAPLGISFEVKGLWKAYSAPTTKYRWHRTA